MAKRAQNYRKFDALAVRIVEDLIREIPSWEPIDAIAALGNIGHECAGFNLMQETKPLIPGSRGGWGWAQWTGPRRRAFEKWVAERGLDPSSYEANLGFLLVELRGSEKAAVAATKRAITLEDKVKAFEQKFERAGIKHYPSRVTYAQRALRLWKQKHGDAAPADPAGPAEAPRPPARAPVPEPRPNVLTTTEIRAFQQRLRDKGYVMVGEPDGKMGPRTRAAITAFQTENSLPITGEFDELTRHGLDNGGKPMEVSPERAQAPSSEIASKVPEAAEAKKTGLFARIQAFFVSVGLAVYGMKDYVADAVETLRPVKEAIETVPTEIYVIAIAGLAGVVWWQSRKTEQATVEAYRSGART